MSVNRKAAVIPPSRAARALLWAALIAWPALLSAQAAQAVDPFYQKIFDNGKAFYQQGNFQGAVESMEIAFFGFLDHPDMLLESYIYLQVSHYGLRNAEKSQYYYDEIKRLKLADRVVNLRLPDNVRAKYDESSIAFERYEARLAGRTLPSAARDKAPASKTQVKTEPSTIPPPVKKPTANPPDLSPSDKTDPAKSQAFLVQARQETRQARKIKLFKQALESDPNNTAIYFEMNDAYFAAKKYREGVALMDVLLKYYPDDIRVHLELAENLLADKNNAKAYTVLVQASRLDAKNIELRYLLGKADMGLKRYKEAVAEFDFVLAKDPGYKDAASQRAFCAAKINPFDSPG